MDPIGIPGPVEGDGNGDEPREQPEAPREQAQPNSADKAKSTDDHKGDQSSAARQNPRQPGGSQGPRRRRPQRRQRRLPRPGEIRQSLAALPQLIATGALSPAQGNSVHSVLKSLLEESRKDAQPQGGSDTRPSLRDAVRTNPQLLDLLAPLLPHEQLFELANEDDESEDPADQADETNDKGKDGGR